MTARPDLTQRTGLSKSALSTFEWCQTESWLSIHHKRPFVPNEPVVFGSAVDRGVEVYITAARAGLTDTDLADLHVRALAAALEVLDENEDIDVSAEAVDKALRSFHRDIIPSLTWTGARTQAHINLELDQLGECDGHPDIIFGDNRVADVKTGSKAKQTARTLELGFYALLVEADTGQPVPSVSYITYARGLNSPRWTVVTEPVTDEFRRWAYEGAAAYVRAKKADEVLNRNAETPSNYSFSGGPAWAGKCAGCVYSPANGGPCVRAFNEEVAA
jgi:CRISPR/Cas system-associated exonuclease Cas4 (RecB family)